MKQRCFTWSGLNSDGHKERGQAYDINADLLKLRLAKQGLHKLTIRRQLKLIKRKVGYKEVTHFIRQLSIMLKAGLPLLKALDVLIKSVSPMHAIALSLRQDIEQGRGLAESLRKHPKQFDALFCNIVQVGELAGILDSVLLSLVEYREKTQLLKAALFKALSYPSIVLIIALGMSVGLLIFVVPQFQSLFSQFNTPLPMLTQIVIHLSNIIKHYAVGLFLFFACSVWVLWGLKQRSETLQLAWDKAILHSPVVGRLIQTALLARFARTLGLVLAAGMPLPQAMPLLAQSCNNRAYKFAMAKAYRLIENGQPFHIALKQTGRFPILFIQMVQVGEESGHLDTMLAKAAEVYQQDLDQAVSILKELLEPAIMTVLGFIIGGLVIAMYLPVFNLGTVI
ncbi:MAG: type secretory pathway, component PulF [Gammaproteobacteria bacterium]|jgi:type IV pilus assembly protein PilC|nr:type secretory pathway, component PulF [Gammaproteobacteria bacterium]